MVRGPTALCRHIDEYDWETSPSVPREGEDINWRHLLWTAAMPLILDCCICCGLLQRSKLLRFVCLFITYFVEYVQDPGMIPRLCKGLFEAIGASESADKTSVSASYIEVSLRRKNCRCYSVGTP